MFRVVLVLGVYLGCCLAADTRNLVEYLEQEGYTQLVDFLKVADLTQTLEKGVFTIFAPTDAAFSQLQPSFVQKLFLDPDFLKIVLQSHITSDTVIGPLIKNDERITTMSGDKLRLNSYPNNVYTVEGIPLVGDDVVVANGVIHKIDSILVPSEDTAASYVAADDGTLRDFFASLALARLFPLLEGPTAHLTVFAPTDKAFDEAKAKLAPIVTNPAKLAELLKYHLVNSTEYVAGMTDGRTLNTLHNALLTLHISNGSIAVNDANVLSPQINVINGVIHLVDKVLFPSDL